MSNPGLLSTAPTYVEWFAQHGEFDDDETVVGFFAETKPDPADPNHRVVPDLWVVVTTKGLYYLDTDTDLCVRARALHALD